jgi:hypothetical protein
VGEPEGFLEGVAAAPERVAISHHLAAHEVSFLLEDSQAKVVLADADLLAAVGLAVEASAIPSEARIITGGEGGVGAASTTGWAPRVSGSSSSAMMPNRCLQARLARSTAPPTSFDYLNAPEKTAHAMRGDLFSAGDLGYADEDGWLFTSDRRNDMILAA